MPKISQQDWLETETDELVSRLTHREESVYVDRFVQKAQGIIEQSPITRSFKSFILEEMRVGAIAGGSFENPSFDDMYFFFDRRIKSSGGIFDPARAIYLERIGIARLLRDKMRIERGLVRVYKIMGLESTSVNMNEETDKIEEWKREFLEKYGEEV